MLSVRRLPSYYLHNNVGLLQGQSPGIPFLGDVLRSLLAPDDATLDELEAATLEQSGGRAIADGKAWRWNAASLVNDATRQVAIRPSRLSSIEAGRWILDSIMAPLEFPFTAALADAAPIFAVPAGVVLIPYDFWLDILVNFSGGSTPAIAFSSNKTGFTAKGSILGGPTGNVAADLTTALSPTRGTRGTLAGPKDSRIVEETVAVSGAAATPTYAIKQLLYAKTIGTGAPAVKAPQINGATPSAGEAAPNAGGTSVVFHAETTGTGTVDLAYLTAAGVSTDNAFWKEADNFRYDKITGTFGAGSGKLNVLAAVIYL